MRLNVKTILCTMLALTVFFMLLVKPAKAAPRKGETMKAYNERMRIERFKGRYEGRDHTQEGAHRVTNTHVPFINAKCLAPCGPPFVVGGAGGGVCSQALEAAIACRPLASEQCVERILVEVITGHQSQPAIYRVNVVNWSPGVATVLVR